MTLEYIIARRTNGANPFKIFEEIQKQNQDRLELAIKAMPYAAFMETAYWFAVASVSKSRAGMRCQVCNSARSISTHHRTYDTHGREHQNMADLTVLCENCHGLFHGHSTIVPVIQKPPQENTVKESGSKNGKKERSGRGIIDHRAVEADMPAGDHPVILTRELIQKLRANGAFTNATLNHLPLPRRLTGGWPSRLYGMSITLESYQKALEGRYIYGEKRKAD